MSWWWGGRFTTCPSHHHHPLLLGLPNSLLVGCSRFSLLLSCLLFAPSQLRAVCLVLRGLAVCVFCDIAHREWFFLLSGYSREREREMTERRAGVLIGVVWVWACRTRHAHAHTITINDQRHVAQLLLAPPPRGERERERDHSRAHATRQDIGKIHAHTFVSKHEGNTNTKRGIERE